MVNQTRLRPEEIESRALSFSKAWEGVSSEKSEGQRFIIEFLQIFRHNNRVGEFEKPIATPNGKRNYIDFFWKDKIAIEMKSRGRRLDNAFEQLSHYMAHLPEGETPPDLWMVCDFEDIHLYQPSTNQSIYFKAKKLHKYTNVLAALADYEPEPIRSDKGAVDLKATAKMNRLFEALLEHGYSGRELEVYLARLLFCLFADDTGIFTQQNAFFHYIKDSKDNGSDLAGRLAQLFQDLNEPCERRVKNPFLADKIDQDSFRYINGGLFEGQLRLASFNRKMRDTMLECLSFDWSKINPAIFGSMFQGVMDKGDRRETGAHYTTEENILKLISPLFMDSLRSEFKSAKKKGYKALAALHDKIADLKFLDPACGCGNFLIIAYRELRHLELEIVREKWRVKGIEHSLLDIATEFRVNVGQFYGIEILSWPCQIARTGMWLMDHLMNMEVSEEFGKYFDRLPLTKGAEIINANAHGMDWGGILPQGELSYILGNPPFVGARWMSGEQKEDMRVVFGALKSLGNIDYVTARNKNAADMMSGTNIKTAFVSTNSITQGEQVTILWKPLMERGIFINFGIPTFKWDSEAKGKAAVHCVIVGFSYEKTSPNISPYLIEAPSVFLERRTKPLCGVPEMVFGSMPNDGGNLIIEENEYEEFINEEPSAYPYIKRFMMGEEFINNKKRWCLWLVGISPSDLRKMPLVMKRIEGCKKYRSASKREVTRKLAGTNTLFGEIRQPNTDYIALPKVSSERRHYIPIGYLGKDTIAGDKLFTVPNGGRYHFGILTSNVHMAWMRAVCGRMKSDYSYSNTIVYNNFPWLDATNKQKASIEKLAQEVLDARAKYPESSLADLYDPLTMPPDLLKAHNALDRAVMKLYGFEKDADELAIVAALMERYQKLSSNLI
jgi:hypothetical protein